MVKIDWPQFFSDRVWFGWRKIYTPHQRHAIASKHKGFWSYSLLWEDRLYPMYHRHKGLPDWYLNFANRFYK